MSVGIVNPEVAEKGNRIVNALLEGGVASWSTLIGKNIAYAVAETDYGQPDEMIKAEEWGEAICTSVDWSGDNRGTVLLLVPIAGAKEVVAYMMTLMLGGDANPDTTQLDSEGMDAYSEAVNNFFGQGAQQARGEIGGAIKTAVGPSRLVDFAEKTAADTLGIADFYCAKVKVTIEGRPPFTIGLLVEHSVTGVAPEQEPTSTETQTVEVAGRLGVDPANLSIAMKIKLPLVVTIASKKMRMELIQDMCPGTIIEFRKMSGENLDVLTGNVKIATAEAVIINQCFGVQIRSIVDPKTQIKE